MKPTIGVIPLWDDKKESIWMVPGYMDAIRESGAIPIIFPLKANRAEIIQLCYMCSGFLLTGGHDVNPSLYNQQMCKECGQINSDRDFLEQIVFDYAAKRDVPLLGICRGIQLINCLCGGTLYQDLPTEFTGSINHQMTPPYHRPQHKVRVVEDSPLHKLTNSLELDVNSYHHQAIKQLSPHLEPMAISEDGLVEAVYMKNKRCIWAIQWHPEFNYHCDPHSRQIINNFISKC